MCLVLGIKNACGANPPSVRGDFFFLFFGEIFFSLSRSSEAIIYFLCFVVLNKSNIWPEFVPSAYTLVYPPLMGKKKKKKIQCICTWPEDPNDMYLHVYLHAKRNVQNGYTKRSPAKQSIETRSGLVAMYKASSTCILSQHNTYAVA